VIVEPPWLIFPSVRFSTNARETPLTSMPGFFQNVLSSVAITALIRIWGTSASSAGSRSCTPSLPIWVPLASYTVVGCESSPRLLTVLE
jgi:hypothetical protein